MNSKNIFLIILGIILILAIVFFGWKLFKKPEILDSKFELVAVDSDIIGIDANTAFLLKSSEPLSSKKIKEIVRFEPGIDFKVGKEISNRNNQVFAQTNSAKSYQIIPTEPLLTDSIYRVIISDESVADREYSWAFQVKAPFQVVSTFPGDQAISVPQNTGIEVYFNREELINPEQYFSIEPNIKGTFEAKGNMLVFQPWTELDEKTLYTVTIKKGLKSSLNNEKTGEDNVFSFETSYQSYNNNVPYFGFYNDFNYFLSGDKLLVEYYSYNIDNLRDYDFKVYKFSKADDFLKSYKDSRDWDYWWRRYYNYEESATKGASLEVSSFKPQIITKDWRDYVEIPKILDSGYYLIQTQIDGRYYQAWFQVTPLAYHISTLSNSGVLWAQDFINKEPVPNIEVSIGANKYGKTDKDGLLLLKNINEKSLDDYNPMFFKLEHNDYETIFIRTGKMWNYYSENIAWNHLATDRFVYKMNDTIKYWGVIKGKNEDLRQKKLTIELTPNNWYFANDEPLIRKEIMVSSLDTIQGEIELKGIEPGYYSLVIKYLDKELSRRSIDILDYTKPAYTISATARQKAIIAGQEAEFDISANFFDGTPVSNLEVGYDSYLGVKGILTLDKFGKGYFSYIPKITTNNYWPTYFNISFYPNLSEEGEISSSASVLIFGSDVYLQGFQESVDDNTYKVTAKVNDVDLIGSNNNPSVYSGEYIGNPRSNSVIQAEIIESHYEKTQIGTYYDPIDKIVVPQYKYNRIEEAIDILNGKTNSNGEWIFTGQYPKLDYNHIIKLTVFDDNGRKTERSISIWKPYYSSASNDMLFYLSLSISNKEDLSIGEDINFQLSITRSEELGNNKILYYGYNDDIVYAEVTTELLHKDKFKESYVPNVNYMAVVLGPSGLHQSNSMNVIFNKEDKRLNIDFNTDSDLYKPGDTAKIDINVTDKDNKKVNSEINISIIDEALYHLLPYSGLDNDILNDLYSYSYYSRPYTQSSVYETEDSLSFPGAEMGGCFMGDTKILMSDNLFKDIKDIRVGDVVYTFSEDRELVKAVVQGISEHLVDKVLVINEFLEVTPNHRLNINGDWIEARYINIGDVLINKDNEDIEVERVRIKQGNFSVYNIVVGKYHTYFADNIYVHNEEKGGGARIEFVDVAYYNTVTADNGKATIEFELPDNITSWIATVRAFNTDTISAGQEKGKITVSLPFFVDTTLNDTYLSGDEPILRTRIFGDQASYSSKSVFNVISSTLGINKTTSSLEGIASFVLGKMGPGSHKIQVSAVQGGYQDIVIKEVNVVDSYFKGLESSTYQLEDNLKNVEGNKDGFTRIEIMDQGLGRLYYPLLRSSYQNGTRIDQIIGQHLSSNYLYEYFSNKYKQESLDLSQYHLSDNGLGLFPYASSDLYLTSTIIDLVPDFIFRNKVSGYLYASLSDEKSDIHRTSKALYGLASLGEPVLTKINIIKDNKSLELEDKIFLSLALAKIGDKESARNIYFNEIRSNIRFEGREAWVDDVKLTGLIAVLTSYLNIEDNVALGDYMFSHSPIDDLDIVEEFLYIKNEIGKAHKQGEFSFKTIDRLDKIELEKGRSFELEMSYDELSTLEFSNVKGDMILVSHYEKTKGYEEFSKNQELSISRKYIVSGQAVNTFNEGDVVKIELYPEISASAIDGYYQIVDHLPSGLKPITNIYNHQKYGSYGCNTVWHPNMIKDNAVYFTIWKGWSGLSCSNRKISYLARVVTPGKYKAEPAIIQSLKNLESTNISDVDYLEIRQW